MQLVASQRKLLSSPPAPLPAERLSPKGYFRNILSVFVVIAAAVYFLRQPKFACLPCRNPRNPQKYPVAIVDHYGIMSIIMMSGIM